MQHYLEKFNNLYKEAKSIDIRIFNENPFTIKRVRYNQGGDVCHCLENSNEATQKVKDGWEKIECTPECSYRQKDKNGKTACRRIGWLKFLIPSVSMERIFLMRIAGQKSIDRLDNYFKFQQSQGKSLVGDYTIYLKQEEQSNTFAKTFNNYVLDIFNKEEFNSNKPIPKTISNDEISSTTNNQKINIKVAKQEQVIPSSSTIIASNIENSDTKKQVSKSQEKKKAVTKEKVPKSKEKKSVKKQSKTSSKCENENLNNCYALLRTFKENLTNKQGETKEYLIR